MYGVERCLGLAPAEPQGDCDKDDCSNIWFHRQLSVFESQLLRDGHPMYHADHREISNNDGNSAACILPVGIESIRRHTCIHQETGNGARLQIWSIVTTG